MTEERREELASRRQKQVENDTKLQKLGRLINGEQIIQQVLAARKATVALEEPVLVPAKGGKSGSGKRVSVRR